MLRHPFHGIQGPESNPSVVPQPRAGSDQRILVARRGFFAQALSALAGIAAWFLARPAAAQTPFGGGGMGFPSGGALQGGYGGAVRSGGTGSSSVTTFGLNEEGGCFPPAGRQVTTFALGEEGGYRPRSRVTTFALGEEGGFYYRQR